MKNILLALTFIVTILVFSCEETPFVFDVDCDECYIDKPDSANLIIDITINEENPFVPLVFYRGNIEDGIVEYRDTAREERRYLYSPVDEEYSVKAFYKSDSQTIIAVDGDKLKTSRVSDVCDIDCWVIRGGVLDVRLKKD